MIFSDKTRVLWEEAKRVGGGLLDLVYPSRCLVCDRYDTPALCETCAASFTPLVEPNCAQCGRSVEPGGTPCHTCTEALRVQGEWAFEAARLAAIYEGTLRHAIHRLKYQGGEALGELLGEYLAARTVVDGLFPADVLRGVDRVVAVPMHPERERARGYNQAWLLAAPLARMLGVPLLAPGSVRRVRRRPAQVGLSPDARRRNLAGTFRVAPGAASALSGRHLLLVDDVFTTGATVHACSASLREAGAASVHVVTLAGGG